VLLHPSISKVFGAEHSCFSVLSVWYMYSMHILLIRGTGRHCTYAVVDRDTHVSMSQCQSALVAVLRRHAPGRLLL
jgi:hypothetical protein